MAFVICIVAVAPLRAEAAHQSEMVSQILFGELAEIIEGNAQLPTGSFVKLRMLVDGYEGWCQSAQLALLPDAMRSNLHNQIAPAYINTVFINETPMQVPFGASIGLMHPSAIDIAGMKMAYTDQVHDPSEQSFDAALFKQIAHLFLNTPYLWGGRSIWGIDCSGFVQQVYRYFNHYLPRDAYQQAELGNDIGFLAEAQCGDLAYFDNADGKITHVGIMLSPETIIHASGKVRIDRIDQAGILNTDTGERTHQLRIVKRLIEGKQLH